MIKVLCSPGSRGLWLAQGALTSPASWAVAVGRGGCVALARGSCSAPSPGSAARPGSATPTRTSGGFWAPAWRCLWAASRAGTRTPHRRTCRSSRSACAPCRLCVVVFCFLKSCLLELSSQWEEEKHLVPNPYRETEGYL